MDLSLDRRAAVSARVYAVLRSAFAHREDVPDRDLDREFDVYLETTPQSCGLAEARGRTVETLLFDAPTLEPDPTAFRGRMGILADGGTVSTAEDFVMPFRDNGRAMLVGERTAGSSGQPVYWRGEDGLAFRVGAKRQFFPDGNRFEGLGITPDLLVTETREDVAAGRDPALDAILGCLSTAPRL